MGVEIVGGQLSDGRSRHLLDDRGWECGGERRVRRGKRIEADPSCLRRRAHLRELLPFFSGKGVCQKVNVV